MEISGFENIISIYNFEYCAAVDSHENCEFSCFVKEEDIDSLIGLVDSDISFQDNEFKFSGHVTDIAYSKDISGCFVEVKTVGKTYVFDKDKKYRVFQNKEKTVSDILSFMESISDVNVLDDSDIILEDILFQNNETDWEFVLRICKSIGVHFFTGEKNYIGKSGTNTKNIEEIDCIDYKVSASIYAGKLYCRLKDSLFLGDKVSFGEKQYVIENKKYRFEKEQYYYEYILREIGEKTVTKETNSVYVNAIVTDNNDPDKKGRLQVNFENDYIQDCMKDNPVWIERLDLYASKGLGTVFIPNVDDKVRIHIYEGKAYVIGCVRDEAYAEQYQDSCNKYLILSDKIYFEYKEDVLTLFNKDNKIEITEDSISIMVGEKSSVVSEKDRVCISVDKSSVEIASDISMKTNKVISEAKSDASITATNVNIKGKSGVSIN